MQADDVMNKQFDIQLSKRILSYLKPYKWIVFFTLLAALLMAGLQPLFGLLQRYAIDCYLAPVHSAQCTPVEGGKEALYQGLVWLGLGFLGVKIFEFVFRYVFSYALAWIGQHVLYDIRSDVFGKLQRLHLGYFDKNPVGRLITRVTSDVDAINQFITNGLAALVTSTLLIIAYLAIMFSLSVPLTLVSLVVMPILYISTNYFRNQMRIASRDTRIKQAVVNSQLNENITGMLTMQLFNRQGRNQVKFDLANRDLLSGFLQQVRWFSLAQPATSIIGQLATALVLWYGGNALLGGDNTVTLGLLVAFTGWVAQLFQPVQDLADVFNNMQTAMASSERIFTVLDTKEEITDPETAKEFTHFEGRVDLKNVWFSYDSSLDPNTPENDPRWILRGIDLSIAAGESVALVGATGAGKTSIISLVSRFYDIQKGSVQVDGVDVREYRQYDLRKHIGVVLQDVYLFAGTVEGNLRLGNDNITLDRIIEICKYVGAHDFIMQLPKGYHSEVLERGATFSTGQKQLLAFARALIQNPEVIVVLDEATANIDTESEEQIQKALAKVMLGRTSIIIAHRLSTIEHCNRIVVMRKGKIVEMGSHSELLAKEGYYAKLHSLQYSG